MNLNLRHNKEDKNAYKYLSEDKILELEKLKVAKQLEGEELYYYKLTKWLVSGVASLFIAIACILPLGFKINDTIRNIYIIKYNYVIIDNNIIKKEDSKQAIDRTYNHARLKQLINSSIITASTQDLNILTNTQKETK
ncbi:MAG: hypothetical protein M0R17_04950 [Candidatus Omnitrophica bacterium]|jgi:hypothetical protein|nr:hypothetical protein [Candidatus Omnitrophota bacterium]